jgi:hypothetical protein
MNKDKKHDLNTEALETKVALIFIANLSGQVVQISSQDQNRQQLQLLQSV